MRSSTLQVRVSVSNSERSQVLSNLMPGEALVTLDWAQKLTESYAREKQADYYGKAGMSWHVTHTVTNANGDLKAHTTFHMCGENTEQVRIVSLGEVFDHNLSFSKTKTRSLSLFPLKSSTFLLVFFQNGAITSIITKHALQELRHQGITRVIVRSDNAGESIRRLSVKNFISQRLTRAQTSSKVCKQQRRMWELKWLDYSTLRRKPVKADVIEVSS